jgi:hypothetical protein
MEPINILILVMVVIYVTGMIIGFMMEEDKRIKCNVSQSGEKIYHLKGDRLYNTVKIDKSKGEFYARTETEALEKGFRRSKVR